MNQFRVEFNNTSLLQRGTPTKLACFTKERPRLRGGNVPDVHTRATYPPKGTPLALNTKGHMKQVRWRVDLP